MKRMMLLGPGGLVAALLTIMVLWPGSANVARAANPTSGTGPVMAVTNIAAVDATHVKFDVVTQPGVNPADPQSGFNLEIKWNPTFFTYDSTTVQQIPGIAPASALCPPPDDSTVTLGSPVGSFVNMGCTALGTTSTTLGTLATVHLLVVTPGCSNIHINTYNGPDNGDSSTGSFTINGVDGQPQANQGYTDATINDVGQGPCTPGPLATATSTNTPVATSTSLPPTSTATTGPSATPTASPPGGLRTITPSSTPSETATAAPPTQAPTQPVGQSQQPGGQGPGGAPGGSGTGPSSRITLPSTGAGAHPASPARSPWIAVVSVVAAACLGYGSWRLRRRHAQDGPAR